MSLLGFSLPSVLVPLPTTVTLLWGAAGFSLVCPGRTGPRAGLSLAVVDTIIPQSSISERTLAKTGAVKASNSTVLQTNDEGGKPMELIGPRGEGPNG